ncbi:hypothetical protein DL767_002824 [Monosporascus sp. MG133]|nr:hypothetical protein DL767_002824 [Monosporascus sp. MG133]
MVVRESDPWCMVTAYNKVNGQHCDMSKELMVNIAWEDPEASRNSPLLGPIRREFVAGGGGSSYIKAKYWTSVFESTEREFKDTGIKIVFHTGAKVNRYLPTPTANMIRSPLDRTSRGAILEWHNGRNLDSEIAATINTENLYYMNFGTVPSEVEGHTTDNYRWSWRRSLTPWKTSFKALGSATRNITLPDLPSESAQLPPGCNAAIVVVGRDKDWETEEQDDQELGNVAAAVLTGMFNPCAAYNSSPVPLIMEVLITNTGSGSAVELPGRRTVISSLSQRSPHRIRRPHKQICDYAKSKPLSKSEQHMVKIKTDAYAFGFFDITRGHWA